MQLYPDDEKFVFLDGASGTMLSQRGLKPGQRPDIMNITAPEVVESVQRMYVDAGSDIIYTNTFGANEPALRGTGYTPEEIITAAVAVTKRACGNKAKTALDIGPIGEMIDPLGDLTFIKAYELFGEQAIAGERAGAELAVIETMSDLTELKAAVMAVRDNTALPVFSTMTFDISGRTFAGCLPESFAITAERLGVEALGLNCSLEPSLMLDIARRIAKISSLPLIIKPNAGLPDSASGLYNINPAEFARQMSEYAEIGVKYVGGCCGTSPEYIKELRLVFGGLTRKITAREHGEFICTASKFAGLDSTVKSSCMFADKKPSAGEVLEYVSKQVANGDEIIEVCIPNGISACEAEALTASVREITDRPVFILFGSGIALEAVLRTAGGISAVAFTQDETTELIKTAKQYGAVII